MELKVNKKSIFQSLIEDFAQIELSTSENSIKAEYIEKSSSNKNGTISKIIYRKDNKNGNTNITYCKALTPKSGMNLNFTINPENIIEKCYIDFYTIKNSTSKRNGFYRLEYTDSLFRLYVITSRKNSLRKPIAHYIIDNLTPEKLSIIIRKMINIIDGYIKKHDKRNIIEKYSNFESIEGLLSLENYIKDRIQDLILYGNLSLEEKEELTNFLLSYKGFKTPTR